MSRVAFGTTLALSGSLGTHAVMATALVLSAGAGESDVALPSAPNEMVMFETLQPPEPEPEPEVTPVPVPARARARSIAAPPPEPAPEPPPATEPAPPPEAPVVPPVASAPLPAASAGSVPVVSAHAADAGQALVATRAASTGTGPTSAVRSDAPAVSRAVHGDRSRRAGLAGGARWQCPFPEQAELEGVSRADVLLEVAIDASGQLTHVEVAKDPGYGFGRAALRCAHRQRWSHGLNPSGEAVGQTVRVAVRFERD